MLRSRNTLIRLAMIAAAVLVAVPVTLVLVFDTGSGPTPTGAENAASVLAAETNVLPSEGRVAEPARQLGKDWQSSKDRAVTVDGDATGLHVLVADESAGYAWRTAATLSEPGADADQWIGQACVTASGQRAVVVYAPRQILNKDTLFHQAALAAVVDLASGHVTKLSQMVSIAYHNPGCGTGEQAVLSRYAAGKTTLFTVDAARGAIVGQVTTDGQVTSAVRYGDGIAAAKGKSVISIDAKGAVQTLASVLGSPFRLAADRDGGLAYQVPTGNSVQVRRYVNGKDDLLGSGGLGTVQLHASGGQVFLAGPDASKITKGVLPDSWRSLNVPASAEISTTGALAVTVTTNHHEASGQNGLAATAVASLPISISATLSGSGATLNFRTLPKALLPSEGTRPSPSLAHPPSDPSTMTTDPDRGCAIPRNDPHIQSLQPTPAMIEWAVDLATRGKLTTTRDAGWNGTNLPPYQPQLLFPSHQLAGGGHVPAQVMLGVLAQESNLQQANRLTVPGESGNFISGGFYGSAGNYRLIDWSKVDCGYGIAQVTDGMKRGATTYTPVQQTALTVDYATNIAAGLQILQDKWNQVNRAGVIANNGDPRYLENWFFALWAYNSGYHDQGSDPTGQYGLGWANNPVNPDFTPDRKMFMTNTDDARTPNKWSYPERVMGWAAHSQPKLDPSTGTTKPAFPVGKWAGDPQNSQPPLDQFCSTDNQCNPATPHQPSDQTEPAGACQRDDLKCWWHSASTWTDCTKSCGTEVATYSPGDSEPEITSPFKIPCTTSGMPDGTIVVDDVGKDVTYGLGDSRPCQDSRNWISQGTLSFSFGSAVQNGVTVYPAKVDFHQLGAGFGGHFWLSYVYPNSDPDMRVSGTWTPNLTAAGKYQIQAYVPPQKAVAKVTYIIYPGVDGKGVTQDPVKVTIDQNSAHGWTPLSSVQLYPGAKVELTNITDDATADGAAGFGFDAMAFSPTS